MRKRSSAKDRRKAKRKRASEAEKRQTPHIGNEKCVFCGCDTGVPYDTPVSKRKYYISGSGQLCEYCYIELYICRSEIENELLIDEMNKLVYLCKHDCKGSKE